MFTVSGRRKRNIYCIASNEKASTYDLIQQADIVVMNGGSAAVEAGVCGKQIYLSAVRLIMRGPALFGYFVIVRRFTNLERLPRIEPDTVIRKTLRFIYLSARRFPQFVSYIRIISTTQYSYCQGADSERIISMLKTGCVEADDPIYAPDAHQENMIVDLLKKRDWIQLSDYFPTRRVEAAKNKTQKRI